MDMNTVLKLAPELATAILARNAAVSGGARLTDFHVMALDKRAAILAADLDAACKAQQSFTAWTPSNPRNAS